MKKVIALLIGFNVLFIANQTSACLIMDGGCYNLVSCEGKLYKTQDDAGYKQCVEDQRLKNEKINKEYQAAQEIIQVEKEKIYKERIDELSQYSDFFQKVGVNLTLDTNSVQYENWLEQLKEAQTNYIKEQENQQKIKELEERISNLESKPTIIEKVITPTNGINTHNKEEVIKPTISDNKIIKPTLKKEEIKKDVIEEKPSPVIETITTTETPIIPTNKSFFQRVFNWFKSLL